MKAVMFPGQGSQYKGMGRELFAKYPQETRLAADILGYDLETMCVEDPKRQLGKTQFTQPALYVVNALGYYERFGNGSAPSYLMGHSLGEYNALLAAGAFDFATGLQLVKKRGELMAAAAGGGMAAILGPDAGALRQKLDAGGYADIDIANYNTPTQTVVAGPQESINRLVKDFDAQQIKIIPLFVSAPFHSRYMQTAAAEFGAFLESFTFSPLQAPVISNVTGKPYGSGEVAALLSRQIVSSVQWTNAVRYLMGAGALTYEEIGGSILTKMATEIQASCTPVFEEQTTVKAAPLQNGHTKNINGNGLAQRLGSKAFREDYGIQYAYLAGAMYKGIASSELVVCMGKAGMMGFLGTGGMSLEEIEMNIDRIQHDLPHGAPYGMNLLHNISNPAFEMKTVELYIRKGIHRIEAAGYMQITPALVYYRLKGLQKDHNGAISCLHKVIAKVSRPEVAEAFMRPAPVKIVEKLLEEGAISAAQAALSQEVPLSHDICVEADSGGHTDGGIAMVLLPAIRTLSKSIQEERSYAQPLRVGLAGGIGTPQAVACAFIMGADFVVTGSINQCTVEAGTSSAVKDLLQEINIQDTDYAPAGDMFEIGAKVQVMKKSVLFPARANKLFTLYNQYNALEEIPEKIIQQLEQNYFKKPVATVWQETRDYFTRRGEVNIISQAEKNPKSKMALIFRWYFGYSSELALSGRQEEMLNFQVHTGPALGSFNQWVKGTALADWKNRHVDKIGIMMMEEGAYMLQASLQTMVD